MAKVKSRASQWMGPTLDALRELNGSGETSSVIALVGKRVGELGEELTATHKSGQTRFYNEVNWARQFLVWEGLLLDTSPYGVWELSPKGRETVLDATESQTIAKKWNQINAKSRSEAASEDVLAVLRKDVGETTKVALIRARLGQGVFRKQVLKLWKNRCGVTGSRVTEAIRASHIKPWKDSTDPERLDPDNGIPLVANLDALFDTGLISFDPTGGLIVSPKLSGSERKILGIETASLSKTPNAKMAEYLAHHRQLFFPDWVHSSVQERD